MMRKSGRGAAPREAVRSRLVLALDVATTAEAESLVDALRAEVGVFKVGKQLFLHGGPQIVRSIRDRGGEVFLDLKFHDIPRTVARAGVESQVVRLAKLAHEAGMDGVVASPHEVAPIRRECGRNFLIVTPGVRPLQADWGDQKRVMTPGEAIRNGADYLVVGRPILDAPDPVAAAREIVADMERAFAARRSGRLRLLAPRR